MDIRTARPGDGGLLAGYDRHLSREELESLLRLGRIYLLEEEGAFAGWLRYNLFWDSIPFMNMLYLLEGYRGKGYGRALVQFWEKEMAGQGYQLLMTSTSSEEYAQHFYQKLGFHAVGGFLPEGEPYEIILSKRISSLSSIQ